jgi:multidrug efflux pump subunit AcrA (membrane-fusion protein)
VTQRYAGPGALLQTGTSSSTPALNQIFPEKVARLSFDVLRDTRTMHTEVDVPNPQGTLLPDLYAEVGLRLNRGLLALAVEVESFDREGTKPLSAAWMTVGK